MSRLLFFYDIHYAPPRMRRSESDPDGNGNGNESLKILENILDTVISRYGKPELVGFGGDLGDHQLRENNGTACEGRFERNYLNYWEAVRQIFEVVDDRGVRAAATTGNHEILTSNGWFGKAVNDTIHKTVSLTAGRFLRVGEAWSTENFSVYCFGSGIDRSVQTECKYSFSKEDIVELEAYLDQVPRDKPVIVMSHYPLTRTVMRESPDTDGTLFAMLNGHPNVLFLWGHNHASGIRKSDEHYDRVYTGELDECPLNFTYLSGGCLTADYSGDVRGKALMMTFGAGGGIQIDYLDRNGNSVYTVCLPRVSKGRVP